MLCRELLLLTLLAAVAHAFIGSGDDSYMKKYAIRKVWESCFGRDVVKQIRIEKRAAIAKCRASSPPSSMSPAELALVLAGQHERPSSGPEPRPDGALIKDHFPAKKRPSVQPAAAVLDAAKLQALLAFKQPQGGFVQQPQQLPLSSQQYNPFLSHFAAPQYSVSNQAYPNLATYPNLQSYPSYPGIQHYPAAQSYASTQQYPAGQSFAGSAQYASLFNPAAYSGQQQQQYYNQAPFLPVGYFGNARQRASRDLSAQGQMDLESLHRAIGARAENVSCQLQELGYLDENLDPAYDKIAARVQQLPVEEELKRDMLDGLEFCKRFSQCMPDMRQDTSKFSQDQDKQMFFFSCYKHKKLEACLMKDVRERFMTDDPLTHDDLSGEDLRSLPRGRRAKMPDDFKTEASPDRFDRLFDHEDAFPSIGP